MKKYFLFSLLGLFLLQPSYSQKKKKKTQKPETHEAIINIRKARKQINFVKLNFSEEQKVLTDSANALLNKMKLVEEALYQTKNQSGQDPLNFPIRLNNKLAHLGSLASMGDYRPTDQAEAFRKEVSAAIDVELAALKIIFETDIPAFNKMVNNANIPAVKLE